MISLRTKAGPAGGRLPRPSSPATVSGATYRQSWRPPDVGPVADRPPDLPLTTPGDKPR